MNDFALLRHVSKRYGDTYVLSDVSFTLPSRGLVGILGPSGSGKSTLLNIIAGLDRSYMGSTVLLGQSLLNMNEDEACEFRLRNIGYVYQNFGLLELEKALENVRLPLVSLYSEEPKKIKRKAMDLLRFVGLEKKKSARVNTLSGGEKQRVAIARALANDPRILLADEPTGALDERNAENVFQLLRGIAKTRLVIVVSHDQEILRKYADHLIYLEDGKLLKEEKVEKTGDYPLPNSIRLKAKKEMASVPITFLYHHAYSLIKAKRIRGCVSSAAISVGLLGLGLATYIYSSIGNEVNRAIGSIVKDCTLVAKPLNEPSSPISNTMALDLESAQEISKGYPMYFGDCGVSLKTNYQAIFQDIDDVYFLTELGNSFHLPYYHVEHINDFLFLNDVDQVYPEIEGALNTNEVVLGLPYENMFKICMELGIKRDYSDLGEYILYKNPALVLDLANYGMEFSDTEYFDIRGVIKSDVPCFYHTNRMWNHDFFVDTLRFHPVQTPNLKNAQEMFEVPYLPLVGDFPLFLEEMRKDGAFENLVYEYGGRDYLPSVIDDDHPLDEDRVYLYVSDKYGMPFTKMKKMAEECPTIKGQISISSGSYYADTESVISGFAKNVFLSSDYSLVQDVCETASYRDKKDADMPLNLPTEVISGSLPYLSDGALWIEAGHTDFSKGKAPNSIDEIGLSKSLYEKWNKPEELFIGVETNRTRIGDSVISDYVICPLSISGIVDDNHDTMYVKDYWTYDFFLTRAKVSGFNLENEGAVFYFESKAETEKAKGVLSDSFRDYRFYSPSLEVGSTVKEVTDYIGVVLIAFSSLALLMASLLFLVVMSITLEECKEEDELLHKLGIGIKDRKKAMRMHALSYIARSLVPSLAILTLMEVVVSFFVSIIFGSPFVISLSAIPICSMLAAALSFYVLLAIVIGKKYAISVSGKTRKRF